jgi:deoxyadenosine/deoxycytidine kinase
METINAVRTMATKKETLHEFNIGLHCFGDRLPLGNMSFTATHFIDGILNEQQFHLYSQTLISGGPYVYPNILFLRCSDDVLLERIKKRNRDGESSYQIDYLKKLDMMNHFIFLYLWCHDVVNVIPVDWNQNHLEEMNHLHHIIRILKTYKWKNINNKEVNELKEFVKKNLINLSHLQMIEIMNTLQSNIKL